MNERIQNSELNTFLLKIQDKLPKNLSKQETEEIAYYALCRLQEAKDSKRKTKIVFNPVDTSDPLGNITTRQTGKSAANVANMRYTKGNISNNLYGG